MSDLTPVDIERRLVQLTTQITQAQQELRLARDNETEADIRLKKARLIAANHDGCPKVVRGSTTVAERESWIDDYCIAEWSDFRRATTSREIAQDSLRAVLAVAEVVRSLGSSVRTAYSLAGAS